MSRLVRPFLEGMRERHDRRSTPPVVDEPFLQSRLERAVADARAAWPALRLDERVFAAHLGRSVHEEDEPLTALAAIHVRDLYLACACLAGVPGAAETLDRTYRPTIARRLARIDVSDEAEAEAIQGLFAGLFVQRPDGRPPPLTDYEGRGALSKWLAISAARLALNSRRGEHARNRLVARLAEEPVAPRRGPEESLFWTRHRGAIEAAITEAVAALPRRQRTLLRLHLVGRLSKPRLAKMFLIDPTTVMRHLDAAHHAIWSAVRKRLQTELRLSPSELESLLGSVESQLDISISTALASSHPGGEPG